VFYWKYQQKGTKNIIHTKLHRTPKKRIFHILAGEASFIFSASHGCLCKQSVFLFKKKLHIGLKIFIVSSRIESNIVEIA